MAPSITESKSEAPADVPAAKSLTTTTQQHEEDPALLVKDRRHLTPLQALSQGTSLPGIPIFSTHEKTRHFLLSHMAGAFRVFARKGFTEGISGHISVRDPENPHTFWTNPLGVHFGLLKASDMVLVDYSGRAVGGNTSRPANAAGFLIHSALHKARPDVHAACHTHSKAGKAWSAFARPLAMLNQDVCYVHGDAQAVYADFGGVVFTEAEGDRLAAALGPRGKVMHLRNHGLLTVGHTVDEAAFLHCLMERSCEVQLMVEAAEAAGHGKATVIPDDMAAEVYRMASDPETLYWEFQPDLEYEREMCGGAFEK
jgi:ribulose-5-phosphate 4-epimerase/fuculose-1-phosphate aldolase